MKRTLGTFLFAMAAAVAPVFGEAFSSSTEYEIKGAFLYNFAKFVEWPPSAFANKPDTFVIGILGHDPFGSALDDLLEGKSIQDKKLKLRRLSTIEEASACDVLFISASKENELPTILDVIKNHPVLTVSDMPSFVEHGGVVGFSVEDKKVRFNINTKAAENAELKISSQLLKLAKTIISKRLLDLEIYVWSPFETTLYKKS